MTLNRLIVLLILIALLIFLPSKVNGDAPPEVIKLWDTTPVVILEGAKDPLRNSNVVLIADTFPNAPVMLKVANAESGYNEKAKNPGSTARGLFQVIQSTQKNYGCTGDMYDPEDNVACAKKLYDKDGTSHWLESKLGWSTLDKVTN